MDATHELQAKAVAFTRPTIVKLAFTEAFSVAFVRTFDQTSIHESPPIAGIVTQFPLGFLLNKHGTRYHERRFQAPSHPIRST
jgi:hypothetical protein